MVTIPPLTGNVETLSKMYPKISKAQNAELRLRWCQIILKNNLEAEYSKVKDFLHSQVRPWAVVAVPGSVPLGERWARGTGPSVPEGQGLALALDRPTEGFGLEGTFKGHLVQPPCHGQGHLALDQVAQSPVQPGLEHFQGWGIHNFSGQPVPVSHRPHRTTFLPYVL